MCFPGWLPLLGAALCCFGSGLVVGRAVQPGVGEKHLDAIVAWYRLHFSHRREFQNVSAFFGGLCFSLDDLSSMDAHALLAAGGSAFASLGVWGARDSSHPHSKRFPYAAFGKLKLGTRNPTRAWLNSLKVVYESLLLLSLHTLLFCISLLSVSPLAAPVYTHTLYIHTSITLYMFPWYRVPV